METSRNRPDPRTAARRKAAMKRRRRQAALRRMCIGLMFALVIIIVIAVVISKADKPNPLVEKYTLEAGSGMEAADFLRDKDGQKASFVTDLDELNLKVPGEHEIKISVDGKTYTTTLLIQDTVAPTAQPVNTVTKPKVLPKAEELVKNIVDATAVTVTYQREPDVSKNGDAVAVVLLTDAAGNSATVEVPVKVFVDTTAPVITGAQNREIFIGDSIAYKEGITVTDDHTSNPVLMVDNTAVKPQTPGIYPVIYTARDAAGNETSVTVYFTLRERPSNYVEPEVAYQYARDVLNNKIKVTPEMSKAEVAAAIYNWVKRNIGWYDHSNKENGWPAGAVDGFEQRRGDCFTYYSVTKALLDVAGIPNLDVVKVVTPQTSQSSHYWNLVDVGDGWYHMDCTPRANNYTDSFFLYTDEEMLAYSRKHKNCFNFDLEAYPPRATESVQQYLKFSVPTVTIKESW